MAPFEDLLARLERYHGEPALPPACGPLELILWENACYLLPDERRAEVFEALRSEVGLNANAIWNAPEEVLLRLAKRGGMQPETRVFRWREIARITLQEFQGDLSTILNLPYAAAKKALRQFPTIGDPGAEKILLMCGQAQGLPLESNGLRVLIRVGYGRSQKTYNATYQSVQRALAGQLPAGAAELTRSHLLLRQHGKTLCKATAPWCSRCPAADLCAYRKTVT